MQLALWHGSAQGWPGRAGTPSPVCWGALPHPRLLSSVAQQSIGLGVLRAASDCQQSSADGGSTVHKVLCRGCKGDSELCKVDLASKASGWEIKARYYAKGERNANCQSQLDPAFGPLTLPHCGASQLQA